jgi:hypothetical protein
MTTLNNSGSDLPSTISSRHPAIAAWARLHPCDANGARVVCLQTRYQQDRKVSSAFALHGYGPGGSDLIAKHCRRIDAQIEHQVYESILPRLGLPTLEYYGLVESEEAGFCWLFVALADGEFYSAQRSDHRIVAGDWLGQFHTRGSELARDAGLPDRVPEPHHHHLTASSEAISFGLDRPSLGADESRLLQDIIGWLKRVEGRWSEVEDACGRVPRVLLHGDFLPHNMRVASRDGRVCLLPFDWALAGWGSPAIDLAQSLVHSDQFSAGPDIEAYWSVVRRHWPVVRFEDVCRLAHFATIFQCLSALHRDAPYLASTWPEESIQNMYFYRETLERTLIDLDWV